jgi:hypothetical protein
MQCLQPADVWRHLEATEMTPLKTPPSARFTGSRSGPPLRPLPTLVPLDKAPAPKPLVMGTTVPPRAPIAPIRTHWQPTAMPKFPIEPANDPLRHLADDDRLAMTLLTLVLCVTVAIALLGFGLQVLQ